MRSIRVLGLLAALLAVLPTAPQARPPADPKITAADLALVARSGASYVTIATAALLDHAWIRQPPPRLREGLTELRNDLTRRLGISLDDLERVTLVAPVGRMAEPVALFYSREKNGLDIAAIQKSLSDWKQEKLGDRLLLRNPEGREGLLVVEERMVAAGRADDLVEFLRPGQADVTLTAGLASAEAGAHLVVGLRPVDALYYLTPHAVDRVPEPEFRSVPAEKGFAPEPRKEDGPPGTPGKEFPVAFLAQPPAPQRPPLAEMLRELPPQALPFKPLLLARAMTLSLTLGEDSVTGRTVVDLGRKDEGDVRDGAASLRVALYVVREALPRLWLRDIDQDPRRALDLVRAVDRAIEALKKTDFRVEETQVTASATVPLDPPLVSLLLRNLNLAPPTGIERQNNLKIVGIALHGYHDTIGALPGTAIYSQQGKPLLSWRVAILPYIEQQNLYQQFNLDEPWDGPTNIKLLEKMPKTYAPPRGVKADPGHTFLQAFSGPDTMFDVRADIKQKGSRGIRITDVTDGLSNTAMVGESGKAVPWTKPDDIPCDGKAVPVIGCIPGSDRTYVVMGDGSVRAITTRPRAEPFYRLVNRHDGQVIDVDDLNPGR